MALVEGNEKTTINISNVNGEIREEIVTVAVKFLKNPNVVKTSIAQRKQFLKTKGLTDQEIEEAFKRANLIVTTNENFASVSHQIIAPQPSMFIRIRDGLQSIAVISALMYGLYVLYRDYIYPFFFGRKKEKTVKEQLTEMNNDMKKAIDELKETIAQVHIEINDVSTHQREIKRSEKSFDELKEEIETVKGLLLNRKQFPSVPHSAVVPPSIPAWQLSSAAAHEAVDRDKSEELIDCGSRSGSSGSETEVVTKNSDSSIEIISNTKDD